MIYQAREAWIDQHFARFGAESYAIDEIMTVDVSVETKPGILWMSSAAITMVSMFNAMDAAAVREWAMFLFFAVMTAVAYSKRPGPKYHLMLCTTSEEVKAATRTEKQAIMEMRAAIEIALIMKGRQG